MLDNLPPNINIVEVAPRDGLQNEKSIVALKDKIEFISLLIEAGFTTIESASFVRSDNVPQMGDSEVVMQHILKKYENISFPALVPNIKGLELALNAGVRDIAVLTATSNTFNQRNINMSVDESLKVIQQIMSSAIKEGLRVRGYISTAFGCPYEGSVSTHLVVDLAQKLFSMGAETVSIGDTIGCAHPLQVRDLLAALKKQVDVEKLAMHFHDTQGLAIANILTSLELGIKTFDSSAGGLGGCPYAPGAKGNVTTEFLIHLCQGLGIHTGIDLAKLQQASAYIKGKL